MLEDDKSGKGARPQVLGQSHRSCRIAVNATPDVVAQKGVHLFVLLYALLPLPPLLFEQGKDSKGKNGKGDKKGDQRSKEERTKPRDQLQAVVDAIDENLMDNVPCEICKRRGRAQYGTRHNARQCNDNPRGSNFEPWFGFDRHGNRKGSKAAKDAWLKRKVDVATTSGSGSGSSSKTITFRSEDDFEKEVERRTSLKRVREKQEQEKFTRMMDTYNSSRGTVTVNRDDLAKLRRNRTERNSSLGQDIEDESKWVFDPVTGVRI